MLENLSAVVGYAMHDDLLMRRKQDARVAEAHQALREQRREGQRRSHREAFAKALIALAIRLAPTLTRETQRV
jgi:hypothetical protein